MASSRTCWVLRLAVAMAVLLPSLSSATTIGYWRFETDTVSTACNPSAASPPICFSSPNEIAGGTPMTSDAARLDGVNLPTTTIPLTFDTNQFSAASQFQGGDAGINASAAWYDALAVTSVTIEFWARTVENTATPFRWTSGGQDGITLTNPNSLDLSWWIDVGGVPTLQSLNDLADMDGTWRHYAFSYDEVTGIGTFYIDGGAVASLDGPDGSALLIAPGTAIEAGVLMDFASSGEGTLDELKIDGSVLEPENFLIPEPGTGLLVGFGLLGLARRARAS